MTARPLPPGWTRPAPSVTPDSDQLRDEIAQALHDAEPRGWRHLADVLLASPALRQLIADLAHARSAGASYRRQRDEARAAIQRVRALADKLASPPTIAENGALRREHADRIRRALDGIEP